LETYLNLGVVGLVVVSGLVFATFVKSQRNLLSEFDRGRLQLSFLVMFLVYNWTEAALKSPHFVFFAFYIVALDYPRIHAATIRSRTPGIGRWTHMPAYRGSKLKRGSLIVGPRAVRARS
jgi:hypothetical protein